MECTWRYFNFVKICISDFWNLFLLKIRPYVSQNIKAILLQITSDNFSKLSCIPNGHSNGLPQLCSWHIKPLYLRNVLDLSIYCYWLLIGSPVRVQPHQIWLCVTLNTQVEFLFQMHMSVKRVNFGHIFLLDTKMKSYMESQATPSGLNWYYLEKSNPRSPRVKSINILSNFTETGARWHQWVSMELK